MFERSATEYMDRQNNPLKYIFRSIFFDIFLIFAILTVCYFWPVDENSTVVQLGDQTKDMLSSGGYGIMIAVGVIWFFGTLFTFSNESKYIPLFLSFILTIMGVGGSLYGFFGGLLGLGIFMALLAYVVKIFNNAAGYVIFSIATICIILGGLFWKTTLPDPTPVLTEEEMMQKVGEHPLAKWRITTPTKIHNCVGEYSKVMFTLHYIAEKEKIDISEIRVILINVPPSHARKVGANDWIESKKWEDYNGI